MLLSLAKHVSFVAIILVHFIDFLKTWESCEVGAAQCFFHIYLITDPFDGGTSQGPQEYTLEEVSVSNTEPSPNCFSFLVLARKFFFYLIIFCCAAAFVFTPLVPKLAAHLNNRGILKKKTIATI